MGPSTPPEKKLIGPPPFGEQGEKVRAVLIIGDDILSSIPPTCDMVKDP